VAELLLRRLNRAEVKNSGRVAQAHEQLKITMELMDYARKVDKSWDSLSPAARRRVREAARR
jgi:F420-dependent methylenetetrahydromethanopterin dehydrogenase